MGTSPALPLLPPLPCCLTDGSLEHGSHAGLWEKYAVGKYNASPNSAEKVLGAIDPDLVQEFNQTLTHQWDVYSHAVGLFQQRYGLSGLAWPGLTLI